MADEAFALSPISARAAMPGEADYEAIREAFMETSRGRWFLSEYAKRNRNADTRMVLDAVARIEANIAAQKDAAPEHGLADVLAAIKDAVDQARAATSTAMTGAAVDERLVSIRKGAQGIREILSRLRDIGADGRIYDSMDSEVSAIEAGCENLAAIDTKAALNAAFDLIDRRITAFEGDAQSQLREAPPRAPATVEEEALAATAGPVPPSEAGPEAAALLPEAVGATMPIEAATAAHLTQDDAVLELIALEMAAPDLDEFDIAETHLEETNPVEAEIVARPAEPAATRPEPIEQPSLGASLIADGIVGRSDASVIDPLAPIRRMSQAEKIAFFS
jgi:hypothetical protein